MALSQKVDEANKLAREGIALVDKGLHLEGIKLLAKARNLNPAEFDYPYEIGRAYMLHGKPIKAEKHLFPLQYRKGVTPEFYLLLGACYDSLGKPIKEEEMYRYGLEKFPSSGKLYYQLAGFYVGKERIVEGLSVCELGLQRDPSFAENYFLASRIMHSKGDALWAWWYGEIFLNLSTDAVMKRGLARQVSVDANAVCTGKWNPDADKLSQAIYAATKACLTEEETSLIARQVAIRSCFVQHFEGQDTWTSYLRELKRQNVLPYYVATLFAEVDKEGFLTFVAENGPAMERFTQWFYWNGLKIESPFTRHTITIP